MPGYTRIRMASGTLEPPRLRTSSAHTSSIGSQIAIVDEWKPRAMSRTRRFFVLRVYHVATCCARSSERALPEDGLRACKNRQDSGLPALTQAQLDPKPQSWMGGSVCTRPLSLPAAARAQILEHFAKCDQIGTNGDSVTAVRAVW